MKKIGITGQNGFVGYHLTNELNLLQNEFQLIEFERSFFYDDRALDEFVGQCDVIVHLAALNRHNDANVIHNTNVELVRNLKDSLIRTNSTAHVVLSSSTQEKNDNVYGNSKKEGRMILSDWANQSTGRFSGLIIPNVFGPFGHPYYNSVVATFCHQITHGESPKIEFDGQLNLIYVGDLVDEIVCVIRNEDNTHELIVQHRHEAKVSELLNTIKYFQDAYFERGEIPAITTQFEHQLFNTYRCYMDISNYFPRKYMQHPDHRGAFTEIGRIGIGGQVSFSTTVPEVTRGNHFHTRKIERFAVIKGKALIQLRRIGTEEVFDFELNGDEPAYVDMPIWYTHNIKNIGTEDLYTIFWINEPYNQEDPDTYIEVV
jgi:UDP-2-acetamido-2,6-beta-L-arabino-hexul-4-ose reductase